MKKLWFPKVGERVKLRMPKMTAARDDQDRRLKLSRYGVVKRIDGAYIAVRPENWPKKWPKSAVIEFYPSELAQCRARRSTKAISTSCSKPARNSPTSAGRRSR